MPIVQVHGTDALCNDLPNFGNNFGKPTSTGTNANRNTSSTRSSYSGRSAFETVVEAGFDDIGLADFGGHHVNDYRFNDGDDQSLVSSGAGSTSGRRRRRNSMGRPSGIDDDVSVVSEMGGTSRGRRERRVTMSHVGRDAERNKPAAFIDIGFGGDQRRSSLDNSHDDDEDTVGSLHVMDNSDDVSVATHDKRKMSLAGMASQFTAFHKSKQELAEELQTLRESCETHKHNHTEAMELNAGLRIEISKLKELVEEHERTINAITAERDELKHEVEYLDRSLKAKNTAIMGGRAPGMNRKASFMTRMMSVHSKWTDVDDDDDDDANDPSCSSGKAPRITQNIFNLRATNTTKLDNVTLDATSNAPSATAEPKLNLRNLFNFQQQPTSSDTGSNAMGETFDSNSAASPVGGARKNMSRMHTVKFSLDHTNIDMDGDDEKSEDKKDTAAQTARRPSGLGLGLGRFWGASPDENDEGRSLDTMPPTPEGDEEEETDEDETEEDRTNEDRPESQLSDVDEEDIGAKAQEKEIQSTSNKEQPTAAPKEERKGLGLWFRKQQPDETTNEKLDSNGMPGASDAVQPADGSSQNSENNTDTDKGNAVPSQKDTADTEEQEAEHVNIDEETESCAGSKADTPNSASNNDNDINAPKFGWQGLFKKQPVKDSNGMPGASDAVQPADGSSQNSENNTDTDKGNAVPSQKDTADTEEQEAEHVNIDEETESCAGSKADTPNSASNNDNDINAPKFGWQGLFKKQPVKDSNGMPGASDAVQPADGSSQNSENNTDTDKGNAVPSQKDTADTEEQEAEHVNIDEETESCAGSKADTPNSASNNDNDINAPKFGWQGLFKKQPVKEETPVQDGDDKSVDTPINGINNTIKTFRDRFNIPQQQPQQQQSEKTQDNTRGLFSFGIGARQQSSTQSPVLSKDDTKVEATPAAGNDQNPLDDGKTEETRNKMTGDSDDHGVAPIDNINISTIEDKNDEKLHVALAEDKSPVDTDGTVTSSASSSVSSEKKMSFRNMIPLRVRPLTPPQDTASQQDESKKETVSASISQSSNNTKQPKKLKSLRNLIPSRKVPSEEGNNESSAVKVGASKKKSLRNLFPLQNRKAKASATSSQQGKSNDAGLTQVEYDTTTQLVDDKPIDVEVETTPIGSNFTELTQTEVIEPTPAETNVVEPEPVETDITEQTQTKVIEPAPVETVVPGPTPIESNITELIPTEVIEPTPVETAVPEPEKFEASVEEPKQIETNITELTPTKVIEPTPAGTTVPELETVETN
eukprot:CAMPEP_0172518948 /NCGR_PEP_ID=MMETSP1066-20121228/291121_1 /TAXON_ID=671091 /ORGANISM="Coscinodiscus wailesii, Strain CCMP2513" /LENGTH=1271 /DNA_ID=CAMNT_0013301439 /DNA_START=126 /DNA_END=3938 /DNA_ORIENTATION=-